MADTAAELGYPAHWEADVLLLDGTAARLRPIRSTDADLLVDFYTRVSPESKYKRFFAPYPTLSDRDVERFTTVDYSDRVGLVITLGTHMVAVGGYERVDGDEAEVAFLVEDDQQGRGVAQLLLEHLAQAGRESGIQRFVADVLPENSRMIHTFHDAGYTLDEGIDDGVLHLTFPIDPTDTSVAVMLSREHRSEAMSMRRLFDATSVAVIGASRREDTIGRALVRNLVLGGYTGRVFVVNPAADAVGGMPAYDSVQEIPGTVELAVVAVPTDAVHEVVLDCAAKGVHGLIVVSSGFAETGEEGRVRQRRLVGLARSYGLRLVGPNCLGLMNTSAGISLNASLAPALPSQGRVGFFSQSGALGVAILETVARRGLGLSTFMSAGNRADVSGNDLLQYWEEDPATEVVLLYLESIGNPRKFSRIARRVGRRKPVVAVTSGRATQGVPVGHSVRSTAAPAAAVDAMFRQAGVIQVDTLDEMFDVAQLLAHQPLPAGRRVAVVGNSDALGLLAASSAEAMGLVVEKLGALPPDATAADFEHALDQAISTPTVDAVIAVFIPPLNTGGDAVARVLAAVGQQSDKPLVSTFMGAEGIPELLRVPDQAGAAGRGSVPSYHAPETAVRALARVVEHAQWRNRPPGSPHPFRDIDKAGARRVVSQVLSSHPGPVDLTAAQVAEVLDSYGIVVTPTTSVQSVEEAVAAGAAYGWDVVLKATAERVRERPDLAHVWRTIDNSETMVTAWRNLTTVVGAPADAAFVVQPMAAPGIPLQIASVEDALFGPIVSFGMAGAPSELLGDVSYRIPPLTQTDAADLVRSVRAAPLLFGYRGSDAVDVPAVEHLILRLAQLKDDLPQIQVLDLDLVLAGAKGATVLRATGRVARADAARSDFFARRLSGPTSSVDTLYD
jgi:acyl-CoA synthetase (NDP forming)/RimJ/RimL family protein N-acetyltransferase